MPQRIASEQLVLQGHVGLGLQTHAGAEDVDEGGALFGQSVDDGSAGRSERSLSIMGQPVLARELSNVGTGTLTLSM